jgi:hypothetical protein
MTNIYDVPELVARPAPIPPDDQGIRLIDLVGIDDATLRRLIGLSIPTPAASK